MQTIMSLRLLIMYQCLTELVTKHGLHARIQRGRGRGSGHPHPLGNHKNTGPDPLKNHKATKLAFNVGPSSTRH